MTRPWKSLPDQLLPRLSSRTNIYLHPPVELCPCSPRRKCPLGTTVSSSSYSRCKSSELTPSLYAAAIPLSVLGQVNALPQTPEKPLLPS